MEGHNPFSVLDKNRSEFTFSLYFYVIVTILHWRDPQICIRLQGNYSLKRPPPPMLIIPQIFIEQRWATVYRFMCNRMLQRD